MSSPTVPTRANRSFSWPLAAVVGGWFAVAIAGWYGITAYGLNSFPPSDGAFPAAWPVESQVARMSGRPTLTLFLHPHCPCSEATVSELQQLATLVPGNLLPDVCVVAAAPRSVGRHWSESPVVMRAARLPNSHVVFDSGGVEASLFDARVSGTVMLFDPTGRLLYRGGVTMSRGHEGMNSGLRAVAALLHDHQATVSSIPPFGCELIRDDVAVTADEPETPQMISVETSLGPATDLFGTLIAGGESP